MRKLIATLSLTAALLGAGAGAANADVSNSSALGSNRLVTVQKEAGGSVYLYPGKRFYGRASHVCFSTGNFNVIYQLGVPFVHGVGCHRVVPHALTVVTSRR